MNSIWLVLALAALPALGNSTGGLLAEMLHAAPRRLNWALHAAAGVVISVVAVELMPRALDTLAAGWIALAFTLGGVTYVAVERIIEVAAVGKGGTSGGSGIWMIYVAVIVDLFSDGVMIGAGSAVSPSVALILAVGQVLADVPEGFATITNMKQKNVARRKRILMSASFALPVLGAAVLAYYILRNLPQEISLAVLMFSAGLLTVAAVEEMMTEAHESEEDSHISVLSFIGGFALFVLVSAGLEGVMEP